MLKNKALLFLLVFSTTLIFSQTTDAEKAVYKWFDAKVGPENTGLLDGIAYRELYKTENGDHQFYASSSFQKGDITYKGQYYFDVDMKYDIHNDEIIVRIPAQTVTPIIQLIKKNVNKFSINNSEFILLQDGFYEVLSKTKTLSLYKKHKKTSTKYYSGRFTFYRFNKSKNEYFMYLNNEYHKITKSKNSFIKVLPEYKNEINSFYKSQDDLLKANYDHFVQELISFLNNKLLNNAYK
jgi:hypothetical protein